MVYKMKKVDYTTTEQYNNSTTTNNISAIPSKID